MMKGEEKESSVVAPHNYPSAIGKGRVLAGLALALLLLLLLYQNVFAPLTVEVVTPQRKSVLSSVMGTGTLEAQISAVISSKISGRISKLHIDQGEQVVKGELLVRLHDEELQQQVAIAQASLDESKAALVRLKADKARAVAILDRANQHHARTTELYEKNSTSLDMLEQAAESLAVANAEVARAEAAIFEGQKAIIAAEKTFEYHRARLSDTEIFAPFSGLVVERHREEGEVALPGSAIFTLVSTEVLWISAWVDETQMAKLKTEQPAQVVFRSQPSQSFSGTVMRLGRQVDRESREFVVDVRVATLPANWGIGQRAEVYITTEQKEDVLTIPVHAVVTKATHSGVFAIRNGTARWQPVTLGIRGENLVEILEGISESDQIIRSPSAERQQLDGRKVRVL